MWVWLYAFLSDLKCSEYTQNLTIAADHLLLMRNDIDNSFAAVWLMLEFIINRTDNG